MFKNYLITAIRTTLKNKLFSVINIVGLALGMACCFLIVLFLKHEFSYDQFHENTERVHRLNYGADFAGDGMVIAACPPPLAPLLVENVPGIEKTARMFGRSVSVSLKNEAGGVVDKFEIENHFFADSYILEILSFEFVAGDSKTALDAPFSLILTEEMAHQFFGTSNVIGKNLYFEDTYNFNITGVVKSYPENAHLEFDMIAPYADMYNTAPEAVREATRQNLTQNWVISHSFTYALFQEGATLADVNAEMKPFTQKFSFEQVREKQNFFWMPVTDLHLKSTASGEPKPVANLQFLYIFLGIGLITLLIAGINFVNFSTAGSLSRAKEVGVRKVLGAGKSSLVGQFLGESLLLSFIAFVVSLFLVKLGLPYLNEVTDRIIEFSFLEDWSTVALFAGIFLLAGLLAGSYPAFFVTRFQPISVLRGSGFSNIPKGAMLRKVLITTQFVASIALIAAAIGIYKQLEFLRSQPMGFNSEQVINVPLFSQNLNSIFGGVDGAMRQKMNAFEEELLKSPNVDAVTLSNTILGSGSVRRNIFGEKVRREDNFYIGCFAVDYDFIETFGLEVIAGRGFGKEYGTDHLSSFILNETGVKRMKYDSPEAAIGKKVNREGKEGIIVGVVKDFHYQGLQSVIEPLALDVDASIFTNFSMRINAADIPQTLAFVESTWNDFFPQKVFEYTFMDESLGQLYQQEEGLGKMIGYFSFLAIFISCFGLYGLVAYAAVQKTKEIGIRKVLGASIPSILALLSKEFIVLIFIAAGLALPAAYFWLKNWLTDYSYAIQIGTWLAVLPLLVVLWIALLTISFQTLKAALANPVESLRHE